MTTHQQLPSILISGFEPFDQDWINPSWEAVKALDGCVIGGYQLRSVQLPVVFAQPEAQLLKAIDDYQPRFVVCFGFAAYAEKILVERVAINIDDARIADNNGQQPVDQSIVANGATAYFSTLPLKKIMQYLLQHGFEAQISNSAGTFVCNHVFYQLMRHVSQHNFVKAAGFIHLPAIAEMQRHSVAQQSMQLREQIEALMCIIQALLDEG